MLQVFANPHHGLVKSEPDLNADDGEIQGIGKRQPYALLTVLDHAFQGKTRDEKAQCGNAQQ